jgi:hypothetical protein
MAAKTTNLMNYVLDRVLKNNAQLAYSWPATVYAALLTDDPTVSGAWTAEVSTSGTAYARQAITWGTIATGSVTNSAAITFPTATAPWGTVSYVAISDGDTEGAGTMLYYGQLGTPKAVGTGDAVSFAISALTVSES